MLIAAFGHSANCWCSRTIFERACALVLNLPLLHNHYNIAADLRVARSPTFSDTQICTYACIYLCALEIRFPTLLVCPRSFGHEAPRQSDTRSRFNIKFNQFDISSIDTSAKSLTVHWQLRSTNNKKCARVDMLLNLCLVFCLLFYVLIVVFSSYTDFLLCGNFYNAINTTAVQKYVSTYIHTYVHTHNRFNMFCADERV